MPTPPTTALHLVDADCTLDADDTCTGCGVFHGDPCVECGQRGYCAVGCAVSEAEQERCPAEAAEDRYANHCDDMNADAAFERAMGEQ